MTKDVAIDTLNQILPHISDIVVTVDYDYRILYANRLLPSVVCKNFPGKSFFDIISPDFQNIFKTHINKVIQSGYMDSMKYQHTNNFNYFVKIFPIDDARSSPYILMTFTLIENKGYPVQEHINEGRIQVQKIEAIGSLATGIAHEFNNILWIINSYLELAMSTIKHGDPARYYLEQIEDAGVRARDLVAQIISFTRQSKQYVEPLKIDLIVKETIKLLKSSIPSTIQINQHILTEASTIMADLAQINLLIIHICANSVFFMKDTGGVLDVSLVNIDLNKDDIHMYPKLSPGKYVVLTISDTGPGIKPDIMNHIFDPYFTTTTNPFSTGMGLSIANTIVKNLNGAISVNSQPEKGTVFHIFIPCAGSDLPEKRYSPIIPKSRGNESILFVDDEIAIIDANKKILERLGYTVMTTSDSMKAFEIFCHHSKELDLIVTDMTMPGLTGLQLAEKILAINPCMPIILCTGYSALISPEESLKLGFSEFLMKPISKQKMAEVIRKILDRRD